MQAIDGYTTDNRLGLHLFSVPPLTAPTRSTRVLVDFGLCAPTRFVFFILVSHCWWTLTCALPLVMSFSHWSVAVGGLWLVRSHSSFLFDTGQSLLVDFDCCFATIRSPDAVGGL